MNNYLKESCILHKLTDCTVITRELKLKRETLHVFLNRLGAELYRSTSF